MSDYTIQRGDCLWNIAKKQYSGQIKNNGDIQKAVSELAKANNISNPNLIYAGNTLVLPDSASIFGQKTDESSLLDTAIPENETAGAVLDLSQFVNKPENAALEENLYEKFNNWSARAADDFYKNGLIQDPEAQRAGYDEIEGRIFDFNKEGSENPRQDGVLELAEGQMSHYDTSGEGFIDFDEYIKGNIDEANSQYQDYELNLDTETYQELKNSFEFFDFNHDNKLEINELKAYYNIVDSSDGSQDGSFSFLQYLHWGQIASTEGSTRDSYKEMLDNLFKESYPNQN